MTTELNKTNPTLDLVIHISLSLACATIVTVLFIITQCRQSFQAKREEFISTIRKINATKTKAKAPKKKNVDMDETNDDDEPFIIGFFHPHCSAGGGGERVLWKIIQALGELKEGKLISGGRRRREKKSSKGNVDILGSLDESDLKKLKQLSVIVYTVDDPSESFKRDLFEHVRDRFSIDIPSSFSINFVHLHEVKYLLDKPKRLTMIMESLGTMQLAWNALHTITPHVFIDTTGCAFTFIVAKILAGCKIGAYVHYPTISTDMLSLVWERRPTYNNNSEIATNPLITYVKLIYYLIFATCYGLAGSLADLTMVNSNWTKGHIQSLWRLARGGIHVVFPPVNTKILEGISLSDPPRENLVLSIGQFRPEKDHILQLKSFALLLEKYDGEMKKFNVKLILIGSCRGDDDYKRVDQLKRLTKELNIQDYVEFVLNQPYSVLHEYLGKASLGIHTMWNEHFGIGVVEMMAAGLVTIAHDSGGPKSDIIINPWDFKAPHESSSLNSNATGLLASQKGEYAAAMYEVLKRGSLSEDTLKVRENGRKASKRFSDEEFMESFKEVFLSSSLLK